jgi:hypothetical protein
MLWPCINQRHMHTKSPFMCSNHSHHVYLSTLSTNNIVMCACLHEPKKQGPNPHARHALNSCTSLHSLGCLVTMACKLIVHDKMKCTHYCYFQGLWISWHNYIYSVIRLSNVYINLAWKKYLFAKLKIDGWNNFLLFEILNLWWTQFACEISTST